MGPAHPLGRDIGGTLKSVKEIRRDDLTAYIKGHYLLPNLVVSVSGGVGEAQARGLVESRLGLPASPNGAPYQPAPPGPSKANLRLLKKETEQAHICIGVPGISYLDDDRYALDIVNAILGEGMSSRLFLEIRERRGLAYDVHSYTSKHRDSGYFAVYAGVDPSKALEACKAIIAELHRIADEEVHLTELAKAREFTKGRLRLGLESTNAMASWLAQQLLLTGTIRTVDEVIAIIDGLTAPDLRRGTPPVMGPPHQMASTGPLPATELSSKA